MSDLDLSALRTLAEKGPWAWHDAAFIAAANPTTVLDLLDRLDAVKALCDEYEHLECDNCAEYKGAIAVKTIRVALEGRTKTGGPQ